MRHPVLVFFLAAALGACASAPNQENAISCPAEQAVYRLRNQPVAELRLMRAPLAPNAYSDLVARVDFEGEAYWFAFVSSLGYSRDYVGRIPDPFDNARPEDVADNLEDLAPAPDPEYSGSELISFDKDYNVVAGVPQTGQPAPAHLVATGIGSAIWYSAPRRELQRSIWDMADCDQTEEPLRE